jgi:hypothetical protein
LLACDSVTAQNPQSGEKDDNGGDQPFPRASKRHSVTSARPARREEKSNSMPRTRHTRDVQAEGLPAEHPEFLKRFAARVYARRTKKA